MEANVDGALNTAVGLRALQYNTSGDGNIAIGVSSFLHNTTGYWNVVIGASASQDAYNNIQCVSIGTFSNVGTVSNSYTNAIAVGYAASVTADNYARIGNTSVSSIGGQVGWSTYSDGRFKRNVQENVPGLDFITRLRPLTYQWDIDAMNAFTPNPDADALTRKANMILSKCTLAVLLPRK
jgi:hypothetical protein